MSTSGVRLLAGSRWLPLAVGLLAGLVVAEQPLAPVGLVAVAVVAWAAYARPELLVGGMFAGILLDRLGATDFTLAGFPITASKLTVLGSLGMWLWHSTTRESQTMRWHPIMSMMMLGVSTTALTIAINNCMGRGKFVLFGLIMMVVLVGLVYAILAESDLRNTYRGLGIFFVANLALAVSGGSADGERATGTMGDPNEWATLVLMITPWLLGGLVRDPARWAALLRVGLMVLAPAAVLLSMSRSAQVMGGLVVAPACLYLMRSQRRELALMAAAGAALGPFVVDLETALARLRLLLDTLQGKAVVEDYSLNERSELLRQGVELFQEHWLVGAGPGMFSTATGFLSDDFRLRPAHNTYLEIAGEQGIVGLTAAGAMLVVTSWFLYTGWRRAQRVEDADRVLGVFIGLLAVCIMGLTLGLLTFSMGYLMLGFALALLYQAKRPA